VIVAAAVASILGPPLLEIDPNLTSLLDRLRPPAFAGGTPSHLLGTDHLGRDLLSRLLVGARISLLVGMVSTAISVVLGVALGLFAGYRRGAVDDVIMRIGDAQLSIPFLVLAISVVAVLGAGVMNVILILGVAGWIQFARIVRAETLALSAREFVEAARAVGARDARILFRHMLPNVSASIIVMASFQFAQMIVVESSLSFLGLGVRPPTASWGTMINDGRNYIQVAWWLTTIPGFMIMLVVLGANTFGDWLRDRLEPHMRNLN
jgi:peptide/nickel transport system permease protein